MWTLIKHLHASLALVSVSGFPLRGLLLASRPDLLRIPWIKRGPHVVDTLLLTSGVLLAWHLQQAPFVTSYWLSTKMLALIAYIGFGMPALNHGNTRGVRRMSFGIALLCAAYILVTPWGRNELVLA